MRKLTWLLLTLPWKAVLAQEPVMLTETKAVALALASSQQLREAEAALAASRAQAATQGARRRPQLALGASLAQRSSVPEFRLPETMGNRLLYPSIETVAGVTLTLTHNLDLAGALRHSLAAALAHTAAARFQVDQVRLEVTLAARTAFWQAVAAQAYLTVAEKDLERSEQTLADTRLLQEAGLATEADLLTAHAERERGRVALLAARSEAQVARAELRSLLGLPEDEFVELHPEGYLPPPPGALQELLELARTQRPELAALRHHAEALRRQAAAERAAGKPGASVLAQYDWSNPNPRYVPQEARWHGTWSAGVVGTWTVYDGGATSARAACAAAEADAAHARLREAQRLLALEVVRSRQRLEDALARTTATTAAWEAARAREEAVRDGYLAGIARLADLVAAQAALARAEFEAQQSRIAAWLAFAQLQRSLGQ